MAAGTVVQLMIEAPAGTPLERWSLPVDSDLGVRKYILTIRDVADQKKGALTNTDRSKKV